MDSGHFILKLINFDLLYFSYLFSRLGVAKQVTLCLWGWPLAMALNLPWIRQWPSPCSKYG